MAISPKFTVASAGRATTVQGFTAADRHRMASGTDHFAPMLRQDRPSPLAAAKYAIAQGACQRRCGRRPLPAVLRMGADHGSEPDVGRPMRIANRRTPACKSPYSPE